STEARARASMSRRADRQVRALTGCRSTAPSAFLLPGRRAKTSDAKGDLDGLDQLWTRQRARASVQRDLRAQAAFPFRPRTRPEPDRLPEALQARGQASPGRRGPQGVRV